MPIVYNLGSPNSNISPWSAVFLILISIHFRLFSRFILTTKNYLLFVWYYKITDRSNAYDNLDNLDNPLQS